MKKQRWEESEQRQEEERRRKKKEDQDVRKGRRDSTHSVFPMSGGPGGSRSRLAKAAGAEPFGEMRDEQMHVVVARSTF